MSDNIEINIKDLEDWGPNEPLEARKLQQPVTTLKAMAGVRPGQQDISFGSQFEVRQFKVIEVKVDYFTAFTWDGNEKGDVEVKIALPFDLRQTPFTGVDDDGVERSLTIKLTGAVLTYVYEENNIQRKATSITTDDEGEVTEADEQQVIIPSYEVDRVVYAMRGITGGVDVQDEDGNQVIWMQIESGQTWMSDNDPPEEAA